MMYSTITPSLLPSPRLLPPPSSPPRLLASSCPLDEAPLMGQLQHYKQDRMKLSSIIAKEIRLKHLNSGILHTETRNKYRNYKLKEHYQTPASRGQLVMYSNAHGNQFVFRKDHFDAADFPDPAQTYFLIADLQHLSTRPPIHSQRRRVRALGGGEGLRLTRVFPP